MRELKIGTQTVRVRATALALLFYKQEFKADLLGDLMKMEKLEDDPSQFDTIAILQLVWAMAKADAYGKPFPSFVDWVAGLEALDISDSAFMVAALEEAAEGFFRTAAKAGAKAGSEAGQRKTRRK